MAPPTASQSVLGKTSSFGPPNAAPPAWPAGGRGQRQQLPAAAQGDACVYDELHTPAQATLLVAQVLRSLTTRVFARALVVQCGGGRLATQLPANEVVGLDGARHLLGRAQKRVAAMADRARFCFAGEAFTVDARLGASFDLVVLDGLRAPLAHAGGTAPLRLAVLRHLAVGGHLLELLYEEALPLSLPFVPLRDATFGVAGPGYRLRHTVRTKGSP